MTRTFQSYAFLACAILVASCGDDEDPRGGFAGFEQEDGSAATGEKRELDGGGRVGPRDAGLTTADTGLRTMTPASDAALDARAPQVIDAGASGSDAGVDVPSGDACAAVSTWDPRAAQFEQEVLRLTNEARARGHNCDSKGNKPATTPVTMEPRLRCAARLHSKYMAESGDFNHTQTKTGSTPQNRIEAAGYTWRTFGENIAAGQRTPEDVVNGWLDSDGHCDNIMNPAFTQLGVGYVLSSGASGQRAMPYWTQNFAAPASRR